MNIGPVHPHPRFYVEGRDLHLALLVAPCPEHWGGYTRRQQVPSTYNPYLVTSA